MIQIRKLVIILPSLIAIMIIVYSLVFTLFQITQSTVAATIGLAASGIFGWYFGRVSGILGGYCIATAAGLSMQHAGMEITESYYLTRFSGMFFTIMTGFVFGIMRNLFENLKSEITRRQEMEHKLLSLNEELEDERERSEKLLLNVLPLSISNRLKENPSHIADTYSDVTILFADIVGFTKASTGVAPNDLVNDLNTIFTSFDALAQKHGLEKIKTIGDSYMAVSGLPEPQLDHAQRAANLALDMLEAVKGMTIGGTPVIIRIGLNVGEVTAGVIGSSKFHYDLWGDSVNIASRMEYASSPNHILVPEHVYNTLADGYHFAPRGEIDLKGRGVMKTFYLKGRIVTQLSA